MAKKIDATGIVDFIQKDDEPDDSCPKCGGNEASRRFVGAGKVYNGSGVYLEHLLITCLVCGFKMRVPCLDCPDPDAYMACDFVEEFP